MGLGNQDVARGEEFERKAEKKIKGWGLFCSKYEDAADLYQKAANSFKLSKSYYRQVSVMSPSFCVADYQIELCVSQRVWQITGRGDYVVNDVNGNLMFKIKGIHSFSNTRKLMFDANGAPIATLKHKQYSARSRWQVFRGDSTEEKDVILSARRSSRFQTNTKLHIFLANNTSEDVSDYSLVQEGSLFNRSYKVYVADSSTVIAELHMNSSIGSRISGKNQVRLRVYKNVDHAFIVVLMVILEEITSQNS